MENEVFVDVKDFEGVYRIGNKGTLLSNKKGEWKTNSMTNKKGGYFSVVLKWNGRSRSTRIHRLVYEHFVGEIPKGHKWHIHHKDHNKQNNCIENLELVSSKEHYQKDIDSRNIEGMRYYNQHIRPHIIIQKDLNNNFIAQYDNAKRRVLPLASVQEIYHKSLVKKNLPPDILENKQEAIYGNEYQDNK